MRTFIGSDACRRLLIPVALCAVLLVVAHTVAAGEESARDAASGMAADTHVQDSTAGERADPAGSAGSAGMRIYRDPATGEFTVPPPGATILPPATRALGTSAQGLVETPGTSTAGGVTVNLGGRFQSAVSATAGDAGTVTTGCRLAPPGSGTE